MSLEVIRKDIVTAIDAVKTAYGKPLVIEYDNIVIVDTTTQVEPFLTVEIKITDSYQVELSNTPLKRYIGSVIVAAAVKQGKGSASGLKILDFFTPRLERKRFGTVRTHIAAAAPKREHLGWCYFAVSIPFWSDHQT